MPCWRRCKSPRRPPAARAVLPSPIHAQATTTAASCSDSQNRGQRARRGKEFQWIHAFPSFLRGQPCFHRTKAGTVPKLGASAASIPHRSSGFRPTMIKVMPGTGRQPSISRMRGNKRSNQIICPGVRCRRRRTRPENHQANAASRCDCRQCTTSNPAVSIFAQFVRFVSPLVVQCRIQARIQPHAGGNDNHAMAAGDEGLVERPQDLLVRSKVFRTLQQRTVSIRSSFQAENSVPGL